MAGAQSGHRLFSWWTYCLEHFASSAGRIEGRTGQPWTVLFAADGGDILARNPPLTQMLATIRQGYGHRYRLENTGPGKVMPAGRRKNRRNIADVRFPDWATALARNSLSRRQAYRRIGTLPFAKMKECLLSRGRHPLVLALKQSAIPVIIVK